MRLKPLPHATLIDALKDAASSEAGLRIVSWDGVDGPEPLVHTVPYGELLARSRRAASELAAQGVTPGAFVLMVLPNGLDFVTTFFATLMAGATPVPLPYPAPFDDPDALLWNIDRIVERTLGGLLVLHEPLHTRWAEEPRLASIPKLLPPTGTGPEHRIHDVRPDDLALVQFTSGSTGHPRGVMLSHANLVANCSAIGMGLRVGAGDVGVSWLPLCHDMGLIGALLSMMAHRVSLVLMSPFEFVMEPARWLWAISTFKGTMSTAPNFAYALLNRTRRSSIDVEKLDLSSWRIAMCGAEPVNADVLHRFADRFKAQGFAHGALFPVYGLAESSLAVTFPSLGTPLHVDHVDRNALSDVRRAIPSPPSMPWTVQLTGLGGSLPGHRVRIVDDDGRLRAERDVGEICVRGPSVTRGYLRDDESTAAIIKDGWLHTGDLGYLADGHLFVCGRKKDVIIFRGRKYYPQDLERAAEDVDGVRKGNVVAFGEMDPGGGVESVSIVLETRVDDGAREGLVSSVKARVQECTGVPVERVVLLAPGELPKTPSGKVRRNQCRTLFGRRAG